MPGRRRSSDWGIPRWRAYDSAGTTPISQRRCDRDGCDQPGTCPAPKAPNRPERWWFCEAHAAEYNRAWNYFAALDGDAAAEAHGNGRFRQAAHWGWADAPRARAEREALRVLELPPDADASAIKAAWRRLAKANHPDLNPGDAAAAARFRAAQAAYDVLTQNGADRTDSASTGNPSSRPRNRR